MRRRLGQNILHNALGQPTSALVLLLHDGHLPLHALYRPRLVPFIPDPTTLDSTTPGARPVVAAADSNRTIRPSALAIRPRRSPRPQALGASCQTHCPFAMISTRSIGAVPCRLAEKCTFSPSRQHTLRARAHAIDGIVADNRHARSRVGPALVQRLPHGLAGQFRRPENRSSPHSLPGFASGALGGCRSRRQTPKRQPWAKASCTAAPNPARRIPQYSSSASASKLPRPWTISTNLARLLGNSQWY